MFQGSEYLTFEDIFPIWASKLRTDLDKQDIKILAHDSKYCIVGEVWDLVELWQTIKQDRQKHANMLKEALEKEIHK
jgi:hypothetical protein